MYEGVITNLTLDRGFGFIEANGRRDIFFHCKDLVDMEWTEQLTEQRVRFDISQTPKGPRAANVRPAV